jgi:hypothetical protein
MWSGQFLAGPWSDQHTNGYALRWWDAMQWKTDGHLPLWTPYLFGGYPVFAGFGDLFYPTTWLRLVLPTVTALNLTFVLHYVLAGFFLYVLLRLLDFSWTAAITGGTAYQLSGIVASLVSPGHDGKLFVTALLPLMLIGLVLGIRRRHWEGFSLFGLAVGLALLSPQYQMTQYALVASGVFTLYLTVGEPSGMSARERWLALAGAAGGVLIGFGISMIQVLPFFHYIPFSPRAQTSGYAWSASYGMPWSHVPELFLSGFTGHYETYWGPNPIKLHSEYLGLPILALAALGVGHSRRRLVWWVGGIGLLFLLVSLGSATPFFRLWYALVPYVKKTRAPGMALYVVAFAVSTMAALGIERLERREGKRAMQIALAAAGFVALLAVAGVFGSIALGIARAIPVTTHDPAQAATAAQSGILAGALGSAIGLALVSALALAFLAGRVPKSAFATLLALLIGADLFLAGRPFWHWSRPEQEQFRTDPLIERMRATPAPFRVLDVGTLVGAEVYAGDLLMRHQIGSTLGYSAVELRAYDDLLGGRLAWTNLRNVHLWNLLAIRYAIVPDTLRIPGYHPVLGPVTTGSGTTGYLYEADTTPPYARVVPAAVKGDTDRLIPTLIDPRMDYRRLVLLDPGAPVNPRPVTEMPAPSPTRATVSPYAPGRMGVTLDPPPAADSYLLISENWYPDWQATVDGSPTQVLRGDATFLTVPVTAGAREVELRFDSRYYRQGKLVTWLSLLVLALWAGAAVAWRKVRTRG